MRKIDFRRNHELFDFPVIWYGDLLQKLIEAKNVVRTKLEKSELVEALVMRVATVWDNLVRKDIMASLNRDSSCYAQALGLRLRRHLSADECEAVLYGHRYLDFRSVGDVKHFGKQFLAPRWNPFAAITRPQARAVDDFFVIRNYVAHYSSYARRAYRAMIRRRHNFKRIPEPGPYLIAADHRTGQYRWGTYLTVFLQCSASMLSSVA